MNRFNVAVQGSIAQVAELEMWQSVRGETRRRLARAVTVGLLYLIAALGVGVYLIMAVTEVGRNVVILRGWRPEQLEVIWMTQIAWCYVALGLLALILYALTMLLIHDKLPPQLGCVMRSIPGIGSTMRMVSMGEFCQSTYQSIASSRTYGDAFTIASQDVGDSGFRRWSAEAAQQIEAGQPMSRILRTSPVRDQPLSAVSALIRDSISMEESVQIWHHATVECHTLAQSRLNRTLQILSGSCLLVSVTLAALAMLLSSMFMALVVEGLT